MVADLIMVFSFAWFLMVIILCIDVFDKSILWFTTIPIIAVAFICLNNYIWCEYEHTTYNDYKVYKTQVNTSEYKYYSIVTNDNVYVVKKSIVEFVPKKTKQVTVTKYKPKFETFGFDNNRIKKVEIGI